MHVVILGASGMLGSMLLRHFHDAGGVELVATLRDEAGIEAGRLGMPRVRFVRLDAACATAADIQAAIDRADWVINAIGLIKQRIVDTDMALVEAAARINTLFSFRLTQAAEATGARVIQVATDCVYSGSTGGYDEAAPHDCLDVYGKTKSLGEVASASVCNLRCSIVGPERAGGVSLLNWFLTREQDARIGGFINHHWNGITTLHFARICAGIMAGRVQMPGMQHVVPADRVTKGELLGLFGQAFRRPDIVIQPVAAAVAIDRTLATRQPAANVAVWAAAGYPKPPGIGEMIRELAAAGAALPGQEH